MTFHRVVLVALATFLSVGMTSFASADCCGWGYGSPVAYAASVGYGGCGGCSAPVAAAVVAQPVAPAPIVVSAPVAVTPFGGPCCSWSGCGYCGGAGAGCGGCGGGWGGSVFGVGYSGWSWGRCGNCGAGWGGGCCASATAYASPLYVVNQGPYYSGPGLMQPYATYSPDTAYAPASDYPYVPGGYGYGPTPVRSPYYARLYYHPHYAYHAPVYGRPAAPGPHYYYGAPQWRHYP